jgi:redox-sensitive bicupin YhaK (pirin superfamily)
MLQKIPSERIYFADYGWHTGRFHFSYADYDDPDNPNFGVLAALNEFELQPDSGFETHPHAEMEIISYCVDGELIHKDGMGHSNRLQSGDVQYLRAGSGITHSEMNATSNNSLRFFQIWISPREPGLQPTYNCKHFSRSQNQNSLQHMVSGEEKPGVIQIAQDANIYTARMANSDAMVYTNWSDRQSYLTVLEGKLTINDIDLCQHDALKVWGEEILNLRAQEYSHFLLVEMALDS